MSTPTDTQTKPSDSSQSKISHRIRSFVKRQGRLSTGQQKALQEQWPLYGLTLKQGLLSMAQVFGREAPTVLEIGFGMGTSLIEMARANPHKNYLGIEVHRPGVGALLKQVSAHNLSNVRVFNDDAVEVLQHCIPEDSLAEVYLFFPDPWHKKRHHKRRIVQPEFVQTLHAHLEPGGRFHMATDWEDYAEHMMAVMSQPQNGFNNLSGAGQFTPRPEYRPLTKFELRGQKLGHGVWDLIFIKSPT